MENIFKMIQDQIFSLNYHSIIAEYLITNKKLSINSVYLKYLLSQIEQILSSLNNNLLMLSIEYKTIPKYEKTNYFLSKKTIKHIANHLKLVWENFSIENQKIFTIKLRSIKDLLD